jgi:hypothetical protein
MFTFRNIRKWFPAKRPERAAVVIDPFACEMARVMEARAFMGQWQNTDMLELLPALCGILDIRMNSEAYEFCISLLIENREACAQKLLVLHCLSATPEAECYNVI